MTGMTAWRLPTGGLGLEIPAHLSLSRPGSCASSLSDATSAAAADALELAPSFSGSLPSGASSASSGSPSHAASSSLRRPAAALWGEAGLAAPAPSSRAGEAARAAELLQASGSAAALEPARTPARRQLFGATPSTTSAAADGGPASSGGLFGVPAGGGRPLSPASLFSAPAGTLTAGGLGPADAASPTKAPSPRELLAALTATLTAQQEQARQAGGVRAVPAPAPRAPAAAGMACAVCHMMFADAGAFRAHCASREHALAVVQHGTAAGAHPPTPAAGLGAAAMPSLLVLAQTPVFNQLPRMQAGAASPAHGPAASSSAAAAAAAATSAAATALHMRQLGPPMGDASVLLLSGGVPKPAAPSPPAFSSYTPNLTPCCNQLLDPHLDAQCLALLRTLRQLDGAERQGAGAGVGLGFSSADDLPDLPDPGLLLGGKPQRRLVGGLREVRKAVRHGHALAVVAAVDIQELNPVARGPVRAMQPGADISDIAAQAAARGVPVIYALTRVGLGSVFGPNKRMSAVALTNVAGTEEALARVLAAAALGRSRYSALLAQHQAVLGAGALPAIPLPGMAGL